MPHRPTCPCKDCGARAAARDVEVYRLFTDEHKTYAEIADALSMPLGTVPSCVSRQRRRLGLHVRPRGARTASERWPDGVDDPSGERCPRCGLRLPHDVCLPASAAVWAQKRVGEGAVDRRRGPG